MKLTTRILRQSSLALVLFLCACEKPKQRVSSEPQEAPAPEVSAPEVAAPVATPAPSVTPPAPPAPRPLRASCRPCTASRTFRPRTFSPCRSWTRCGAPATRALPPPRAPRPSRPRRLPRCPSGALHRAPAAPPPPPPALALQSRGRWALLLLGPPRQARALAPQRTRPPSLGRNNSNLHTFPIQSAPMTRRLPPSALPPAPPPT
jgi:hypothetical protein